MKTTIRIEVEDTEKSLVGIAEAIRNAFPEATSITVESEDGTSETVYGGKK